MQELKQTTHTIDASGKKLGRVASEAAALLAGKKDASYERHTDSLVSVHITNASKLHLPERKRLGKTYITYSGYPGGQKEMSLAALIERKGFGEALRRAVYGMLPHNKLRARAMKRLTVEEE